MSLGPLYVFLGEVSVQVLCPFFNWVVCLPGVESCEFFIYLEIRPLSEVSLANMFSYTIGSLCILMLFSLAMQKLFILMRSHLFILSFMSLALGDQNIMVHLHNGILCSREKEGAYTLYNGMDGTGEHFAK